MPCRVLVRMCSSACCFCSGLFVRNASSDWVFSPANGVRNWCAASATNLFWACRTCFRPYHTTARARGRRLRGGCGQFTIPDFLGARYGGDTVRLIGVLAAILCSFTYVIAQIYGVGLIVSRFTGLDFSVGVFVGLGSVLVCSFRGGMRAVTWTQVAQYVIPIVAYLIPVVWLSVKHTGNPVPHVAYGYVLEPVTAREQSLNGPASPDGARGGSACHLQAETGSGRGQTEGTGTTR